MQPYLDSIQLLVALAAIWFTIREARRNHSAVLRIKRCTTSSSQQGDENNGMWFYQLQILIQNVGISLHDVHVQIRFDSPGGVGTNRCPLTRHKQLPDDFARGMVIDVGFKSYDMTESSKIFLGFLKDPSTQKAYLDVFAQSFHVKSFRIGGFWDRLKFRWNNMTEWVGNWTMRIQTMSDGSKVSNVIVNLPRFIQLSFPIMNFLKGLQEEEGRPRDVTPPPRTGG